MLRGIDHDQLILVEQARISLGPEFRPLMLSLREPRRPIDQHVTLDAIGHRDRQPHAKPAFEIPPAAPRLRIYAGRTPEKLFERMGAGVIAARYESQFA